MIGNDIHVLAKKLWKINRSITGEGVRQTLSELKNIIPSLQIHSVSSGTCVFDWTVPNEWKVNDAYIVAPNGRKICNFTDNNLHLLGYSSPFKGKMTLAKLKEHLYTLPEQPNAIPYITSYYKERWGFCLTHEQFETLVDGIYEVYIDSELFAGELNYGELLIKGRSKKEIFLSTYICHPSMANNELSGPTVLTYLAKWLTEQEKLRYSYRIIFIPETIGSITYLSLNYEKMKDRVIAGFNVTCVGDDREYSYVPSRDGETLSDHVALHVLKWIDPNFVRYTWLDRGSDERQYCAPGIDLPIATLMRTKYGEYPEYHTSLDDLETVVTPSGLDGGYWAIRRAIEALERNKNYKVTVLGEPQMSKHGLYPTLSSKNSGEEVRLMMNFVSLCDGRTSLLKIADRLNLPIWDLYDLCDKLEEYELLRIYE